MTKIILKYKNTSNTTVNDVLEIVNNNLILSFFKD